MEAVLVFSELYHIYAHTKVLLRYNLPETLDDAASYFMWDGTSVLVCWMYWFSELSLCMHLASLVHVGLHLGFYVPHWATHPFAVRIQRWSEAGYTGKWITTDFWLTLFDILVHCNFVLTALV